MANGVEQLTVKTSRGRLIDVYKPTHVGVVARPAVLLWHGLGPNERDVMAAIAEQLARLSITAFAADWQSDAKDGGQGDLLGALAYVREHATEHGGDGRLVTVGWSAGAGSAVSMALRPDLADGWRPLAVVGLAGRYDLVARSSGTPPVEDLATTTESPVPVWLSHGTADDVLDWRESQKFARAVLDRGWPVHWEPVDTDHAGLLGMEYDVAAQRCVPSRSGGARRGLHSAVRMVGSAVRGGEAL
ncbi:alpha/beta hydrolase [Streptomyces sp. H39-S7]|uniref:alpha/beta hydrolase n=1 Tax=Streptomyces sp. H39-S7 TaxID=3004357 RepID=UPI0022AE97DD|nr:carboxylesterase family protein [Streptomyces sp. H39-S7]MCZ4123662.1 carboxylesterase family protein [Streptomyces sp. H39-S7]